MTKKNRLFPLTFALALPWLAVACTQGHGDPAPHAEAADGAADLAGMPPLHVVQVHWQVLDGKPARESAYRQALAQCRERNADKTVPLPEDIASKLGRVHVEYWAQGGHEASRSDAWNWEFADGHGCRFKPVRESSLYVNDGSSIVRVDLQKNTATREPAEPVYPVEPVTAAAIAEAEQSGLRFLGKRSVAGQPCLAWEFKPDMPDPGYSACIWEGAERWGHGGAGIGDSDAEGIDTLWARPPAGGSGYAYDVQSMTVGQPLDDKVFKLPSGIRISDAGDADDSTSNG